MTKTTHLFTWRSTGLLAAIVATLALVVAIPGATHQATASPRCISTPIGCITEQQNLYLHHHPVNLGPIKLAAKFTPEGRVGGNPTFVQWGYFCANSSGGGCINNWGGKKANGNLISFYDDPAGPNGDWNQWYFGAVDSTFPWGTAFNIYTHYQGNSVYQYCWAPNGNGSGYCLDQGIGAGYRVQLWQSNTTSDTYGPQFWVWDGNSRWVAVQATAKAYWGNLNTVYYAGYVNNADNGSPFVTATISHAIHWYYIP